MKDVLSLLFCWEFRRNECTEAAAQKYTKHAVTSAEIKIAYKNFNFETFYATVVHHETIQMFTAKDAARNIFIEGADVSNEYLYVDINPPILMRQPPNRSGIVA